MQSRAASQALRHTCLSRLLWHPTLCPEQQASPLDHTLQAHIVPSTGDKGDHPTSTKFCKTHSEQPWYVQAPQLNDTYADDSRAAIQSALFNFQSLLLVILLLICTCAYVHDMFPSVLDRKKDGPMGVFWKCARIGERLSPYISICCVGMAVSWKRRWISPCSFDFPVGPCDTADLLQLSLMV